jgi:hypothetical protein
MQTSFRDGRIHSFAHVMPACRLAGWLVVIGVTAERTFYAADSAVHRSLVVSVRASD